MCINYGFDLFLYYCFSSMMKFDKHTLSKRFSKFLSKIFWHFNQTVPNFSSINHRSVDKHVSNSDHHRKLVINTGHDRIRYRTHYRTSSIRQRNSTLMSIKEENEIELLNFK